MDSNRRFSFTNLFNLEPLINYKLPQPDADVFDYYGNNGSTDDSRGSQGGVMGDHSNGVTSQRDSKRKRRMGYSSDEVEDRDYNNRVSEEQYRAMLGEHVQKYKRRVKTPSPSPASNRTVTPGARSGLGVKDQKSGSEQRGGLHKLDSSSDFLHPSHPSKSGSSHRSGFTPKHGANRLVTDPGFLDIGDGISYRIPLPYEKMAPSLNLPSLPDIHVEEFYLKGTLDLGSLAAMMASENRFGSRSLTGMGFTKPQYESLQSRLLTQPANDEIQTFDLKVSDTALEASSVPEGSAGNIRRLILSESNILQVCYVKVREKGDTYEIIERSLPKKPKVKKDPSEIEKEEKEKIGRYWTSIVRKDIPRHHRNFCNLHKKRSMEAKRFSELCQRDVKMKVSRSLKLMRGAGIRTRKLSRDMLLFWKRVDKEMAEVRKRQEKEAAVALKREQELREAKRQQQRLNFLLSQTELYSHFMQNKSASQPIDPLAAGVQAPNEQEMPLSSEVELDVEEDPEEAELRKEALKAAHDAVSKQKKITSAFDNEYLKLQQSADVEALHEDGSVEASVNMDLLHPSTMPVASNVKTPELFQGNLKEYQLKGLQWLVNCYEQGLNGILADEMGLGKTIQAIAFLGHLAEEKNIWGPFLVVAPSSVLSNWADEIGRFCPDLKILPYWGGPSERNVLRKHINSKHLYRRDAAFHILITSYQLLVVDEKYFRRVKWQYMVLDEAQAIKSASSVRWKTLLSFNCRNRLLLTGTPIQNNMAELWALLHFIMPTLFDSHEQFNEWFSKGIENHAEHGGKLNEHQLTRLHAILKPFMLRRVKKDVITEMTAKTEVTVHCQLSSRQKAFYQAIKNKISLAELIDGNRGHLNEKKILNLMNIVIQLRKVCNHPELFERNEGSTYFYFGEIPNSLQPPPHGTPENIYYSGCYNPITYKMPKLVYQELVRESNFQFAPGHKGARKDLFEKYFNIFSPENICRSLFQTRQISGDLLVQSGTFGFASLSDLSPSELSFLATGTFMERVLFSKMREDRQSLDGILKLPMETEDVFELNEIGREKVRAVRRMLLLPAKSEGTLLLRRATGPENAPFEALVTPYEEKLLLNNKLLHSTYSYIPRARAPPINIHCADRDFAYKMVEHLHHPWLKRFLVGFARTSDLNGPREPDCHPLIQEIDSELPLSQPALELTYDIFGSCPPFQPFDPAKMLTDSGKLQTLDVLLKRLRAENHRVLLFAQMTKMLNIIEDYMNYRKYKYLRLDGSSTIPERRDMVKDFQERNDIFVFLLSTRAGGLGINLTAADTVIFYESDWNPTLDLQAMDRAHRLGQTKDVTVYRLICKETVEEKILLRAHQKNVVQELVMTGGHVQGDLLAPEDVVSLLIDDPHLERKLKESPLQVRERQKRKAITKGIRVDDEGDASFQDYAELDAEANVQDNNLDTGEILPNNKKRKAKSEKQAPKSRSSKVSKISESSSPNSLSLGNELEHPQVKSERPKRLKRPTKSVNENLEPAFVASGNQNPSMSPS